jgi:hypothetical protein
MQKIGQVLVWAVILLVGTDFVLFFFQPEFKLARELNLVDVFTALLTLFLAIYIPTRLERRLSSKRYELEVLIRGVERLQIELATIRSQVVSARSPLGAEQAASIVQSFTNASHGVKTLAELSKLCERPDLALPLAQIEIRRRIFKRLVTGGGFQSNPTFAYDSTQLAAIDSKYYENDLELAKLIIHINRLL